MKKSVITIAAGKKLYAEYAGNLAMSFLYWNANKDIDFTLITDLPESIPKKVAERINIISVSSDQIGDGFSSKLILNQYLNDGQNLFIDADCLIYGDLIRVFEKFEGHTATVIGHTVTEGLDIGFSKDIQALLRKLDLTYYPLFCGSVYYFEKRDILNEFFNYTKTLLSNYDQLGLIRLRSKENEEPLIGLAMAKFHQTPVADDGLIKADRMYFDYCSKNILTGKAKLWVNKLPKNPIFCTLLKSEPLIIHYNSRYTENYEYISDVTRLRLHILYGLNKNLISAFITGCYEKPNAFYTYTIQALKNVMRPVFKKIFGTRKVRPSNRTI